MLQNLEEVLDFLMSKAIYWLDLLGNSETFLEYEQNIEQHNEEFLRPVLKGTQLHELDYAYLLLQCERYSEAKKYLEGLKNIINEKNEHHYLNRFSESIEFLQDQLSKINFKLIKTVIKENQLKSIDELSLSKFKLYNPIKISLNEYLKIEYLSKHEIRIKGNRGIEHYFHILDGNEGAFEMLKNRFQNEFTIREISRYRFVLLVNDETAFHVVLNKYKSVKNDIKEICQWYERKGVELNDLKNQESRIEIWCDSANKLNTYSMKDKLIDIIYSEISRLIFIPGQYKFVEK